MIHVTSREYLFVPVAADIAIGAQPVALGFRRSGTTADVDWFTAAWDEGRARVLLGVDVELASGNWDVFVRIDDTPEIPVMKAGTIHITA